MQDTKYVKLPEYGRINILGIVGPVNTPIKLGLDTIFNLLATRTVVIEAVKDYVTNEIIGEVELTLANYTDNNYYKFKESKLNEPPKQDEPADPGIANIADTFITPPEKGISLGKKDDNVTSPSETSSKGAVITEESAATPDTRKNNKR